MNLLSDKLLKLREDWKLHPAKREFIEKQAASIKRAMEWYSSPKYLNNKPFLREVENITEAENKPVEQLTTGEITNIFKNTPAVTTIKEV